MKYLSYLFLLATVLVSGQNRVAAGGWIQVGENINGAEDDGGRAKSISINNDGNVVVISNSNYEQQWTSKNGIVRVFENTDDTWTQLGQSILADENGEAFGYRTSINGIGNVIAVGSLGSNAFFNTKSRVKIYDLDGNSTWVQKGQIIYLDNEEEHSYVQNLQLNEAGNILITTINNGLYTPRSIDVFEFINNSWVPLGQKISIDSPITCAINAEGNIITAGSPLDQNNGYISGIVRSFNLINNTWQQMGSAIEGNEGDQFGRSVSLNADGTILAIGAYGSDALGNNTGHAQVYRFINSNWVQIGENLNGSYQEAYFGEAISLNDTGNIVAVGSPGYNNNNGEVKTYINNQDQWQQSGRIPGNSSGYQFGKTISLNSSGEYLAIGSPRYSTSDYGLSQVYTYSSLGIEEQIVNEIQLSPNPAKNLLNISNPNLINFNRLEIFDITGRKIKTINKSYLSITNLNIDISSLSPSMYILSIYTDNKTISSRFIKK